MTTLRKVEFYLVDFDDVLDKEEIAITLENCFMDYGLVKMLSLKSKNIGEWNDDHKFNLTFTPIEEYEKEFKE